MPRFFFHIQGPDGTITDDEGQQFPNLDAVRTDAIAAIQDIVAESVRMGKGTRADDSLLVADEAGNVLLTVSFREAVSG